MQKSLSIEIKAAHLFFSFLKRDKVAVTQEWWCGERARRAITGRVAVEAPVYRMTVTDPGWESLTTQDQDFWVRN